jgi:hypothetical protein
MLKMRPEQVVIFMLLLDRSRTLSMFAAHGMAQMHTIAPDSEHSEDDRKEFD